MPTSRFEGVSIEGIVTSVPTIERRIDDEVELFGGNEKQIARIKKTIGLDRRRVVDERTTAADLCEHAARELASRGGFDLAGIDGLICVTQTPDYSQPCTAAVLHGKLGMEKSCAAFDVNLGCSGYVYGLWLAYLMAAHGGCESVLVLAGDTISRLVHPRDRAVAPLFGDGGSATLVRAVPGAGPAHFDLATDGTGFEKLIVPAGAYRRPACPATGEEQTDEAGNVRTAENLFMDGAEIFNFSITEEPAAVRKVLEYAGCGAEEIDYFVFHQANRYILSNIAKRLKLPEARVLMKTVERYGNQSSASIPSAICGELGDQLCSEACKRLLLSGFGVGLSWASGIIDFKGLSVCALVDYDSTLIGA